MKIRWILLLFPFLTFPQTKLNIAVMDFEGRGVSKFEAQGLSDRFRAELTKLDLFAVMERNQMDMVLKEQGFQQTGACSEASCIVEVGQLIAVSRMITGSIGKIGQLYTVTVKMLDVGTGQIVKNISEDCDCPIEKLVTTTMARMARQIGGLKVEKVQGIELQKGESGLVVRTEPENGARVYVDGVLKDGITPLSLENLPKGKHSIRVKKQNYEGEMEVVLLPKDVLRVTIPMALQKTQVSIKSKPMDGLIYLNGKFTLNFTPYLSEELKAGEYKLKIAKAGYKDLVQTLTIKPNESNTVELSLDKLKVSAEELSLLQKKEDNIIRLAKGRRSAKKYYVLTAVSVIGQIATGIVFLSLNQNAQEEHDAYSAEKTNIGSIGEYRDAAQSYQKAAKVVGTVNLGLAGLSTVGVITILVKSF